MKINDTNQSAKHRNRKYKNRKKNKNSVHGFFCCCWAVSKQTQNKDGDLIRIFFGINYNFRNEHETNY